MTALSDPTDLVAAAVARPEALHPLRPRVVPRVIFLCGHQSRYGLAHLLPVLEHFKVAGVVLASDERWASFVASLLGEPGPRPRPLARIKRSLKGALPVSLLKLRARLLRRELDVQVMLRDRSIPTWTVDDANDPGFLNDLGSIDHDLLVSAAYPQIFSAALLSESRLGAVNFHPSLLPAYRGAHPHFWAIARGEKFSGLTSHFMTPEIDVGDIICQIKFPIEGDTYSQLYERMVEKTEDLVRTTCEFFVRGDRSAVPQNEQRASTFRNEREIHRRIFWNLSTAEQAVNLCRTEQAFCFFRGRKVTCLAATSATMSRDLTHDAQVEAGTILGVKNGELEIKAVDGVVRIGALRIGRKTLTASRWVSKRKLHIGEKFQ